MPSQSFGLAKKWLGYYLVFSQLNLEYQEPVLGVQTVKRCPILLWIISASSTKQASRVYQAKDDVLTIGVWSSRWCPNYDVLWGSPPVAVNNQCSASSAKQASRVYRARELKMMSYEWVPLGSMSGIIHCVVDCYTLHCTTLSSHIRTRRHHTLILQWYTHSALWDRGIRWCHL